MKNLDTAYGYTIDPHNLHFGLIKTFIIINQLIISFVLLFTTANYITSKVNWLSKR